jgi:hypothetical protein
MVNRILINQGELGMSQQKKLEQVLDLMLSEDSDQAAELLHQIIVEKARSLYESIVDEEAGEETDGEEIDESEEEVGGEPSSDFTDEISSDQDDIDSDEETDGEPEGEDDEETAGEENPFGDEEGEDDEFGGEDEGSTEDRVEDLESQLAELRAEFDALMGEEMQEPNHGDLGDEMGDIESDFGDEEEQGADMPSFGGEEQVVGEVVATMYEKRKAEKLKVAPQAKDKKKDKKVDEETKFLNTVADTGQKGTAKLAGTGKGTPLGAEQTKSPYTSIPARKDYGGKPTKIGSGSGGEYGKYNGDSAQSKTPTDNVNVKPKTSSVKADTTPKFTGGKTAGPGFAKSPLTKKPS